jgi:hypothetical protein
LRETSKQFKFSLHKEKEMLDSRKLLLALVVVALAAIPAAAQTPPLSCFAQAAGNPSIRAEGVSELVGDIIIQCSGGQPSPPNENLKQVTIQIFTSPSINITSRIQDSSFGGFSEAMLFIDEPNPGTLPTNAPTGIDVQTICGSSVFPNSVPVGSSQPVVTGVCGKIAGSTSLPGVNTYLPTTTAPIVDPDNGGPKPAEQTYRGNAFQGRQANPQSIVWQGVPFDPPGTLTNRIIRITNVRVNASQLGVPSGSQASVALTISTSASGVENPINLPITNPSPTVAVAQNSLSFSVVDFKSCLQCEDANKDFAGDPTKALGSTTTCDGQFLELRYTELFAQAFRRRNQALPSDPINGSIPPTPFVRQDALGFPFQTESGFYKAAANATDANRWPTSLPNGTSPDNTSLVAGQTGGTLGLADHGTRLIARFNNIQNGIQLWVEAVAPVQSVNTSGNPRTGTATLTTTNPNGDGAFVAANPTGGIYYQVPIIGGTGQAVWEIVNADTTALERVQIRVVFAWVANTTNNLPSLGTSTVNGNLAPLSTVASASTSAAIPRFVDGAVNRNLLTINSCRSNLLFPFVSNQNGFDTGLAISNTTKDPFGTPLQTGACTVNFYGIIGNSKVCLSYPSPSITGGEHFTWSLANGGAVTATAGFQGYVIAQCNFQYAHGYAFLSDLGAQRLAQGYLALVLDDPIADRGDRTGSVSETLGH